jgi:hypothetical protein
MSAWYCIDMPYDYGSQYQLRRWVLERTDEFNAHLRRASPTLDEWVDDIAWIAPVAEDHHELRDEAWSAAGLPTPSPQDAGWWPQRGPVWDAVAEATGRDGQAGAIFVEAKGRESELRSWGSRATDPEGISAIRSALADVQAALETPSASTGWDPRISRRTGWRCCTSRVANGSRPCPSGWSPCTCAASATSPSAGSSGQPSRKRGRPIIRSLHDEMGLPHGRTVLSEWWVELFFPALAPPAPMTPLATWER